MIQHTTQEARAKHWLSIGSLIVLGIYWVALVTATHIPRVPEPLGFRPSDKLVHFTAYGLLAVLVAFAWSLRRGLSWLAAPILLLAVAVHGALDEVTQPFFGRHADVLDWYADVAGAAVGLALFALVRWATARGRRAA